MVLFSGTGCQIAGLKSFLRKDYEMLYTVDVLCHGVPSPMVWNRYIWDQESTHGNKTASVMFRNKSVGWHKFAMMLSFQDGSNYRMEHGKDAYMKCFLDNICLRPSCHSCHFREGRSGADMTLGDAWGIEKWMPQMDDDKGISVVLVNTQKGQMLWNDMCDLLVSREAEAETVLECNRVYRESVKPHGNRKRFFAALKEDASMERLTALTKKPLWKRALPFCKKCLKEILCRICA